MDLAADVRALYADLGENAFLAGLPVRGYFNAPQRAESFGFAGMSASSPSFDLPTADVPANCVGASLDLVSGRWTVTEVAHDGAGVCTLTVARA